MRSAPLLWNGPTTLARIKRQPRVAIIGAGVSGVGIGTRLLAAGLTDFTIFEKSHEVGGTWQANRYPGVACDVPSEHYRYTFAPNPEWSKTMAPGPEIREYISRVADEHGVVPHLNLGTEITEAVWEDSHWTLMSTRGLEGRFDFVVSASGFLHYAKLPDIPGRDSFAGEALHTALWDDTIDLKGKRVGVIGGGSSGTQVVSSIVDSVPELSVFLRTPQWILPRPNPPRSEQRKRLQRRIPLLGQLAYWAQMRRYDSYSEAVLGVGEKHDEVAKVVRDYLESSVADPDLRRRLTPDYEPFCKRMVISSTFYDAIQQPNVTVSIGPISEITPTGVISADGALHELDVLIFATGFDARAFMRRIKVVGRDGVTLDASWNAGISTYRTVAVAGFPNFFILGGPHSPFGTFSFIGAGEHQARYAVRWIREFAAGRFNFVEPTASAQRDFTARVHEAARTTHWFNGGCISWFLDDQGLPTAYPWNGAHFRKLLRRPRKADFVTSF